MNILRRIFLWIWQFPQNLVGVTMFLIFRAICRDSTEMMVFEHRRNPVDPGAKVLVCPAFPSGIALGNYILLKRYDSASLHHEDGHRMQSLYLGPLYLMVIGLPSILGNVYDRIFHTQKQGWSDERSCRWYYNQPWEKWADRLGGVKR